MSELLFQWAMSLQVQTTCQVDLHKMTRRLQDTTHRDVRWPLGSVRLHTPDIMDSVGNL